MSHRVQQKAAARAAREEAERREAAQAARARRLRRLGVVTALALAAVAVGVFSAASGGSATKVEGAAGTRAMLTGIPQDGTRLGDPGAPLVLTEFADLQCPFCRQYAAEVLPRLIERYVRPGKLQLDLKLLRFIGEDSDRGARAALAAGERGRLWNFVDLFYRNQGAENSGYADDAFLRAIGGAAGVPDAVDAAGGGAHEDALAAAEADASAQGIDSTPSFTLGRPGAPGRVLDVGSLDLATFEAAIDGALAR